jgi:MFS family permease
MSPHILVHIARWAIENPRPALGIAAGAVLAGVLASLIGWTAVFILCALFVAGCLIWGYLDWQEDQAEMKRRKALALQLEAKKKQQQMP